MRSTHSLPLLALALRARAGEFDAWKFGNMFALGPTTGDAYITKATWSVVPPSVPCGSKMENPNDPPFMSIWIGVTQTFTEPGMDLFQPLLNWSPDQESQYVTPQNQNTWVNCILLQSLCGIGDRMVRRSKHLHSEYVPQHISFLLQLYLFSIQTAKCNRHMKSCLIRLNWTSKVNTHSIGGFQLHKWLTNCS